MLIGHKYPRGRSQSPRHNTIAREKILDISAQDKLSDADMA